MDHPLRQTLTLHLLAITLHAFGATLPMTMIPLIARLRFDSGPWQMLLITAAVPTCLGLSIFWDDLFRRIRLGRYLLVYWLLAGLPFVLAAGVGQYSQLLLCQVLLALGGAGYSPLNATLLRRLYPQAVRGRAYGLLVIPHMLGGAVIVLVAGRWLAGHPDGYRILLPIVGLVHAVGLVLFFVLGRGLPVAEGRAPPRSLRALLRPVLRMHRVLASDRTFLRYEIAFMTYGAGYMICDALLPLLVTRKLGMNYDEVAESAFVVQRICLLLLVYPVGLLLDRIGAIRTSAAAFAILALYPLGLMAAGGPAGIAVASLFFGLGLAGVMHGWTLGPVTLARDARSASQYLAIHTTLVGVRGIIFQSLGMLVYTATGSFSVALTLAAVAFAWAAWQMLRLHRADMASQSAHSRLTPDPLGAEAGAGCRN